MQAIRVSEDPLAITIGEASVTLTPGEALDFAEEIARKAFRTAMAEEVDALSELRGGRA